MESKDIERARSEKPDFSTTYRQEMLIIWFVLCHVHSVIEPDYRKKSGLSKYVIDWHLRRTFFGHFLKKLNIQSLFDLCHTRLKNDAHTEWII
jgi:hypothetical protein